MAATKYVAIADFGYNDDVVERENGSEGFIRAGEPLTISDADYAKALLEDGLITAQKASTRTPTRTTQEEGNS